MLAYGQAGAGVNIEPDELLDTHQSHVLHLTCAVSSGWSEGVSPSGAAGISLGTIP